MSLFENNGADFSEDRKYRHSLWRIWDESKPLIMFIGLNPSTANEVGNDPTIRRVISFAKSWGYGGVYMMNLFSFVTPYPAELKKNEKYLNQFQNFSEIESIAKGCDKIIFAWGNFEEAIDAGKEISFKFPNAYCLGKNKNGSPKHPLYIKSDVELISFTPKTTNK